MRSSASRDWLSAEAYRPRRRLEDARYPRMSNVRLSSVSGNPPRAARISSSTAAAARGLPLDRQIPPSKPADYAEALRWFNFGLFSIAEDGRLTLEIVNARGEIVATQRLDP